jgi:hypothetical protein
MARYRLLLDDEDLSITVQGNDRTATYKMYERILSMVAQGREVVVVHRPLKLIEDDDDV